MELSSRGNYGSILPLFHKKTSGPPYPLKLRFDMISTQ